jgi:hypothetical protein
MINAFILLTELHWGCRMWMNVNNCILNEYIVYSIVHAFFLPYVYVELLISPPGKQNVVLMYNSNYWHHIQ